MYDPIRTRRRTLSMLWLCVAVGMLFWGSIAFPTWITGPIAKVYWTICCFLGALAAGGAFHELVVSVFEIRSRQRLARLRLESGREGIQPAGSTAPKLR